MTALTDTITALAERLEREAALLYLQARIRNELGAIEEILIQGVSLRKLAEALAAAGVHQRGNQPLSYGNLRQLVTRARDLAAIPVRSSAASTHNHTITQASASGSRKLPTSATLSGTQIEADGAHAESFFTHRQRRQAAKAAEEARRPNFEEVFRPKPSKR